MTSETLEKLNFIYDVLLKKLERQNADYIGLHNKGNYLFAFASAFFAGYLIFAFGSKLNILWNIPSFVGIVITLFFINQVIKAREFKDPPPLKEFYTNNTLRLSLVQLKNKTIASMNECIEDNAKVISNMARDFEIARWLLFFTFVIIMATNSFTVYDTQQKHSTSNIRPTPTSYTKQRVWSVPTPATESAKQNKHRE